MVGTLHIGGHSAHDDMVEQFFALHAHHIHRHLAGYELHTVVNGLLPQRLERVYALAGHDVAHHSGADAHHVHLGEGETGRVGRQHPTEHTSEEVFADLGFVRLLDGVEPPEGEEDAHLLARGCGSVGEDKGGQRLVEVVAEEDESLALTGGQRAGRLYGAGGRLLYQRGIDSALGTSAQEAVARGVAPCLGIAGERRIGGRHLESVAGGEGVDGLLKAEDGAGALDAAGVDAHHRLLGRGCLGGRWAISGDCEALGRGYTGGGGTIGLESAYQIAHLGVAIVLEYVGGEIPAQPYAAEEPHRTAGWDFVHTLSEVVERYIDGAVDGAQRILVGRTHIDEGHAREVGIAQLAPVEWRHLATEYIASHIARDSHGVFGRREGRCVGVLQTGKVGDGGSLLDGEGILVYALVDAIVTHYLCAIELAVGGREGNLDVHLQTAGIVAGMGTAVDGGR